MATKYKTLLNRVRRLSLLVLIGLDNNTPNSWRVFFTRTDIEKGFSFSPAVVFYELYGFYAAYLSSVLFYFQNPIIYTPTLYIFLPPLQ